MQRLYKSWMAEGAHPLSLQDVVAGLARIKGQPDIMRNISYFFELYTSTFLHPTISSLTTTANWPEWCVIQRTRNFDKPTSSTTLAFLLTYFISTASTAPPIPTAVKTVTLVHSQSCATLMDLGILTHLRQSKSILGLASTS